MDLALWRDRAVAVTGAAGFLGSHVTRFLTSAGADVVALVRDDDPPTPITEEWDRARVHVVRGDVCHQATVERVLGEYQVKTVLHLAAQTQVEIANRNPVSTFESNVRGTWSVLEACRRSPLVEQIVVASSDKAYGTQPVLPYTEDMPLLAVHPYDVSKACADLIATSYHRQFGAPVAVSRCGNFYGPGDTNWNRLVPGTIRALVRGERPVIRSDGTPTRDYLHVEDGARAYLRLAEALAGDAGIAGQAFNFSNETPVSVLDVVATLRAALGRDDVEPDVRGTATGEIDHQLLSSEKARAVLGWKPRYAVVEGLTETVGWYRQFLGAAL
ncbi:MAG: GDP-mannose 4,6-dehydratase [Actinobacteria bacterium]|nr:GDP-mannose 4,6-dehydratase [Actinomycetota bacterium]MBV9253873.1 GDP-mannose 4,6-dehydratase [Actinomycetota bacterium]MBV9662508.1 GDP-mannose 4,6-dehydratase [Actinomycetota bacterium]MBV9933826.1 GDP-mannose 4,6-dehydratase [Actinomycetota bacterium]